MAQFESMRGQFEERGVRVAYIAGQSRAGLFGAQGFVRKHRLSFPYLCDETRDVLRAYGIYRPLAVDGVRVAHPSVFLIAPGGTIRFLYVGKNQYDRPSPEQVLEEARTRVGV